MSREIDERIVKMQFDNEQFEKGARQSLKTLDELRAGLDLEGAADSFGQISKMTSKNLGLKQTTRSVSMFSKSLSSMGKVAKSVFNAATFPIRSLTDGINELGKYTRMVLGFDLADKIVNTGKQIVQAFTIDPLKTGMQEYEQLVDSTKTILSGSARTYTKKMREANSDYIYNQAEHLTYVNEELQKLNYYADKTIYRYGDMTSNLGKFTNAGVELDSAVRAMMGIANATAYAGQGANEFARAAYNLSQAMGMGYLGSRDWYSLENANIAGIEFQQTLIDVGLGLKTLERQGDKVVVAANKDVEVVAGHIRDTLNEKWITKDVMMAVFDIFSGEHSATELRDYVESAEQADYLASLGSDARKAAEEVRTYSKMMDALKEAAQSGWSESWKYIIGDLTEATNFWTRLNERLSKTLGKQAETRNAIILGWRGLRKNEKGELEQIEGAIDYRTTLIASFFNVLDVISEIKSGISVAWKNIFGEITSDTLIDLTKRFHDFSHTLQEWFGSMDDPKSRISKISKGLEGFFSIVKMFFGSFKNIGSFFKTVFAPLGDFFVELFSGIGEKIKKFSSGTLSEFFTKIKNAIKNIDGSKLSEWFTQLGDSIKNVWEKMKEAGKNWLNENGFEGIATFLSNSFASIQQVWDTITSWSGWQSIADFFSGAWNSFLSIFQKNEETGEESPFSRFITNAWNKIQSVWKKVISWPGWSVISSFFVGAWNGFLSLFAANEETGEESPFSQFIANAWNSVKEVWNAVISWDGWKQIGQFFVNAWGFITSLFSGGEEANSSTLKEAPSEQIAAQVEKAENTVSVFERISKFFSAIVDKIKSWSGWESIGSFFKKVFGGIGDGLSLIPDAFKNSYIGRVFKLLDDTANLFLKIAEEIVGFGNRLFNSGDIWSKVELIVGLIGFFFLRWASMKTSAAKADTSKDTIGNTFLKIAGSITIIALAIAGLGVLPNDVFRKGAFRIAGITLALTVLAIGMTKLIGVVNNNYNDPVKWGERVLNKLISWAGIAGVIAVTLALFPSVIQAMKDSDVKGSDIKDVMIGLAALISAAGLIVTLSTALTAGRGVSWTSGIRAAVSLGSFLLIIGGVFTGLGALLDEFDITDDVLGWLETSGAVMGAVGEALGNFTAGFIKPMWELIGGKPKSAEEGAQELLDLKPLLQQMGEAGDGLNVEGIENFGKAVGVLMGSANLKLTSTNWFRSELLGEKDLNTQEVSDTITKLIELIPTINQINTAGLEIGSDLTGMDQFAVALIHLASLASSKVNGVQWASLVFAQEMMLLKFGQHLGSMETVAQNVVSVTGYLNGFTYDEEGLKNFTTALFSLATTASSKVNTAWVFSKLFGAESTILEYGQKLGQLIPIAGNLKEIDAELKGYTFDMDGITSFTQALMALAATSATKLNAATVFKQIFAGETEVLDYAGRLKKYIDDGILDTILTIDTNLGGRTFNIESIESFNKALIALVSVGSEKVFDPGFFQRIFTAVFGGDVPITDWAPKLPDLATNMAAFANNLGDADYAKAIEAATALRTITEALFYFSNSNMGSIEIGFFKDFMTMVSENADVFANAGTLAGISFRDAFLKEIEVLKGGSDVMPTVSVVFDGATLDGLFANGAINVAGSVSLDASSITSITSAIDLAKNDIVHAVSNVEAKVGTLEAAIRSMSVILDTGAIAGAVDSYLGGRAGAQGRSGFGGSGH